jgi:hypothetical protein
MTSARGIARTIVVGLDAEGRSAVVADGPRGARTVRPSGAVVHEIWRQESLPARSTDDGLSEAEMAPLPPVHGASVRLFTLPPDDSARPDVVVDDLATVFGDDNVARSRTGIALARTPSLYVATVVAGQAYLVLESSEVLLAVGDNLVLPGGLHAWRNPFDVTAVLVTTVFALAE